MLRLTCILSLSLFAFACGDDGGGDPPATPDAPAGVAKVEAVTCPATADATVTSTDGSFVYAPAATTITVGQTVQFVMSDTHDVKPNAAAGNTDAALNVGFGETKCLKFNTAGTYNFKCNPHGFTGTVTVN